MSPNNHPDDCMCQDCIDARFEKSHSSIDNRAGSYIDNSGCNHSKPHTLREYYEARRNGRISIFGTAIGAYSAFWQWFLVRILWGNGLGDDITADDNFPKNLYQTIHIPDGYALILMSPIVIGWWILCTLLIMTMVAFIMVYFILLGCMYVIFSLPFPILALYSIIFEFPASVVNRDLGKKNMDKYDPQAEWK